MIRGPVQELEFSDEEEDEPTVPIRLKGKKSKQLERPLKIIPTGSDESSDEESDEDGPITMANMEARSKALDAKARREAELDMEELQNAELAGQEDDEDFEGEAEEGDEDEGAEAFELPTAEEREEEKKTGGPQVHVVQRRMRECVHVLNNFKRFAAKGRYVSRFALGFSARHLLICFLLFSPTFLVPLYLGRGRSMFNNLFLTLQAITDITNSSLRNYSSYSPSLRSVHHDGLVSPRLHSPLLISFT